ncbi:MAG TPA: alpha/beta fold hydrolase [Bacteroidia bacterium]|jgi:predicted alpha/beta hydrolase|nr:alpha/beta fold hydrolase [Bacteroidia bacterium]
MVVTKEKIAIPCADGIILSGILLKPEKVHALVQFNGGTAVRKEYYLPFLEYLSEQGYLCCLWDYRGSGESAPASLRDCQYRFSDYGTKDMPAVKTWLRNHFPELPLYVVAHSVGGQQLGFMSDISDIRGLIGFSVSTGHYAFMPWKYRLQCYYFFYVFAPLSIAFTGYVANKRFGYMEDLPRNVVREWGQWCRYPEYLFHEKFMGKSVPRGTFTNFTFPCHYFWASDDPIATSNSVAMYRKHISSTGPIQMQETSPQAYKAKSIGHMGFFKRQFKSTIWKEALDKLNEFSRLKTDSKPS